MPYQRLLTHDSLTGAPNPPMSDGSPPSLMTRAKTMIQIIHAAAYTQMRIHSGNRASQRTGSVCQRSRKGVIVYLVGGFGPFTHAPTLRLQRARGAGVRALKFLFHGGV
jgi:hypothetical protein